MILLLASKVRLMFVNYLFSSQKPEQSFGKIGTIVTRLY